MNLNKRVLTIGGVVTVLVAGGSTVGLNFAQQVMSGDYSVLAAIKWSSIVAGIGIGLFFLIRQGIFANENLEEGERGYRRRWGKIVAGRRSGERKLLLPGKKHFYVKHMYDVVVQSVRVRSSPEEPDYAKPHRAMFNSKNIWFIPVVEWKIIDADWAIYLSLTEVYQVNRAQEGNDALENYIMNQVSKTLIRCMGTFNADSNGLPVITIDSGVGTVPAPLEALVKSLRDTFGVHIINIDPVLLTQAPEEAIRDLKA